MIERWKARLRAWLIDLVREAIRIELTVRPNAYDAKVAQLSRLPIASTIKPASKPVTVSEPSFEQMQAAAIQEQEKYYAPIERL